MKRKKQDQDPAEQRRWSVVCGLGDEVIPASVQTDESLYEFVATVLKSAGATWPDFMALDENPGRWGYQGPFGEWHWRLRRFRNNAPGKMLLNSLGVDTGKDFS